MHRRGGAFRLIFLVQIVVLLSACTGGGAEAPPSSAFDPAGPVTAEGTECRSLNGRLVPGTDQAVTIRGEGRQVTVTLPGEAWCEVPVAGGGRARIRQFVHMPPRVERRLTKPEASPFDMHFAMIEVVLLPPGGAGSYPPAETVRTGYADALRPGGGPTSGQGSGLTALVRRGARADVGAVDPATGCFPVTMEGDLSAPGNRVRHFEMRSRVCVATAGAGAAATVQLLQEWAPDAPDISARYQQYERAADRLFASVRLGGGS